MEKEYCPLFELEINRTLKQNKFTGKITTDVHGYKKRYIFILPKLEDTGGILHR
jgi:hypothetical protein